MKTLPPLPRALARAVLLLLLASVAAGCGSEDAAGGRPGGRSFGGAPGAPATAVPVEVAPVARRDISSFIETNGTLEAENEVDVVARVAAPIVELAVEEGMAVAKGQLLARLDEEDLRAQLEIARVTLEEARLAYDRAQKLQASSLISPEEYEQAQTRFETARAELERTEILVGYTRVRAPFAGLIVTRYVDYAQQVSVNSPLFRLSDFNPLLCPIQVPEREIPQLHVGQSARLRVEAWPEERFTARVLRISPVVDAATGTVKVTLEVDARGRLRPGMFARVFVETATRGGALVIPRSALSLESLGDTVYVVEDGVARRREVALGFREGDLVEAVSGLAEGESVVVVGQDGLSDGTPVVALAPGQGAPPAAMAAGGGGAPETNAVPGAAGGGPPFDLSKLDPEQLEKVKAMMRARGLTEEQIEERLRQARERAGEGQPPGI